MSSVSSPSRWKAVALCGLAATLLSLPAQASGPADGLAGSDLYLNPYSTTLEAAQKLSGKARADAQLLGSIPSADWFTKGTPEEVRIAVDEVVTAAEARGEMPVLVAYNLPFRDCAQYSSGGALDTAAYTAWIDGFAAGIGDRPATVLVEPDGLGVIPHYTTLDGQVEWCQPAELDPATATSDRFEQLNHAVNAFEALEGTDVYLDGTSSAWLNVGEISDRLVKAGVQNATGFFLNASNYQFTANQVAYGTWISSCIAYATEVAEGDFAKCGNQYWNGGPATDWQGVAMSNYGEWSADNPDPELNTSGIDSRYASILGDVEPSTHFVIDTSRNGIGPWDHEDKYGSTHEDWCNPPDRGAGARPTTTTGIPLVDAFLWIKVPGESDGQCYRGTEGPLDPERGMQDPPAGQWFVEQARELIEFASPELKPQECHVVWDAKGKGKAFAAKVTVTSPSPEWTLEYAWRDDQRINDVSRGSATQDGVDVKIVSSAPSVVVSAKGGATEPWLFTVDGKPCTSE